MFYDKKSLKDCHKLCIIYIIFSLQTQIRSFGIPQREIGVSDKKIFHISVKIFDTFSQGGGGGGGGGGHKEV